MRFIGQAANYRGVDILRHTFSFATRRSSVRLRQHLAERYDSTPDRVYLYHNGRSALAAALRATIPSGSSVIVNGFTCHAVVEAVRAAGCTPVYADISYQTLHFGAEELEAALGRLREVSDDSANSNPSVDGTSDANTSSSADGAPDAGNSSSPHPPRAIIIQNTLGIPVDIAALESVAKKHNLVIIEDLAHCAGRTYPDGREVGTVGAATALSFGKGKSVDTISGGALILRHPAPEATIASATSGEATATSDNPTPQPTKNPSTSQLSAPEPPTRLPRLSDRLRDRWYPFLGRLIRTGYYLKLNKILTAVFLKLRWISRSADAPLSTSVRLPHWQAKLALRQLTKLQPPQPPLRAHAYLKDRPAVLTELGKNGFKFDEIWYDVPISPQRYYKDQHFPEKACPRATWAARHIVNLPSFYPDSALRPAWKIIEKSTITPHSSENNSGKSQDLTSSWPQIQLSHPESNFLQSPAWARTNQLIGHQVLMRNFGENNYALMIIKDAKRGRYLEIPGGPLLDWSNPQLVQSAFAEIRALATAHRCAFIRLRPQLLRTAENLALLRRLGAKPAPFHLHAEHTVILDLTKSEEDLLANMRRQTRYEVRRALKQGITVKSFTSEQKFREFHAVQAETARRQNFVPPSLEMLLAEREAFGDQAQLYIAYAPEDSEKTAPGKTPEESSAPENNSAPAENHTSDPSASSQPATQNQPAPTPESPIAYGLILTSGPEAEYFEAASTDLNRKLPGAYALQWQVIRDLKAAGLKRYNLWGIAPPDQPHHRYAKVTTFKTGFGGEVTEFVPAHDIIISRVKYLPNLAVETMRKKRRHL